MTIRLRYLLCVLAGCALQACLDDCGREPAATALSTAGEVPSAAELDARLELLRLRVEAHTEVLRLLVEERAEGCAGARPMGGGGCL